jgi:hypothetical protein
MMVSKEMAKRMDDNSSSTAWPRGDAVSSEGLEVTDVMVRNVRGLRDQTGFNARDLQRVSPERTLGMDWDGPISRSCPDPKKKAGEPAFLCFVTTDSPIVTQPAEGQMKTPDPQGIAGSLGSAE